MCRPARLGRSYSLTVSLQLVEEEKIRGVVSLNEAYELRFFTPSVKVCNFFHSLIFLKWSGSV